MDKKSRAGFSEVPPVNTCFNGDSEHRADFRLEDETCEE